METDPNQQQATLNLRLRQAMYSHDFAEVMRLVTVGADPNTQNGWGSPLVFWCAEKGRIGLVEFALENGADIHSANKSGETALHRVSYLGKWAIIEVLISRGADINHKTIYDATPLYIAASHGQEEAVKTLLKLGADPTIPNVNGQTACEKASEKGHDRIVCLFEAVPYQQKDDNDIGASRQGRHSGSP